MIFKLLGVFFLLAAFTVGLQYNEAGLDINKLDNSLYNASKTISNTFYNNTNTLENTFNYYNSLNRIIYKFSDFLSSTGIEFMRVGIHFGYDNPQYFTPEFIITIMWLLVVALLIGTLYKPITYIFILCILGFITLKDKLIERRKNKLCASSLYKPSDTPMGVKE